MISDSVELIRKISNIRIQLRKEYLCHYLLHGSRQTRQSPFIDIECLFNGESVLIKNSKLYFFGLEDNIDKLLSAKDYTNICDIMKKQLKKIEGKICLEFSGGLDSTGILLSAINSTNINKINTITWFDSRSSAFEDFDYTKISIKNYQLKKHNFVDNKIIQTHISTVKECFPSWSFLHNNNDQYLCDKFENHTFINGHGGDHLFLANPMIEYLFDSFQDKGFYFF